jgi:methylthioribose-1-phosphate isomerase
VTALRFEDGALVALDQTLLPDREVELVLREGAAVVDAIRRLAIRGAPMIGVAGAYGLAMEVARGDGTWGHAERAAAQLREARPTAVNLAYAVDRVLAATLSVPSGELAGASLAEARSIDAEETAASRAMSVAGADFLGPSVRRVMTHCNTGALAVPGRGSALGVVSELRERGGLLGVLACETRPLLQGARLTVWELSRLGIPHELIVDSAAAGLIARGEVDAVVVGCDRVAANGDVANKIGTYMLALAAAAAGIPFVVAGPTSTIDLATPSGEAIVIEERNPDEVRHAGGTLVTLAQTPCRNPAFDVTPAALVTALATERGVASPVDATSVAALVG